MSVHFQVVLLQVLMYLIVFIHVSINPTVASPINNIPAFRLYLSDSVLFTVCSIFVRIFYRYFVCLLCNLYIAYTRWTIKLWGSTVSMLSIHFLLKHCKNCPQWSKFARIFSEVKIRVFLGHCICDGCQICALTVWYYWYNVCYAKQHIIVVYIMWI